MLKLGVIDEIIDEPLGGAHREKDTCIQNLRLSIKKNLNELTSMSREEIFNQRKSKFLSIGRSKGFSTQKDLDENLIMKENSLLKIFEKVKKIKYLFIFLFILLIVIFAAYLL